jgi:ribosomal protein L40E
MGGTQLPSNVVAGSMLSGNATPANTAPGSLAPRSVKPVGGGPNTPEHYPTQPISRGPASRETAALDVKQLPSPAELQAKIAAEAAQLKAVREMPPPSTVDASREQSSLLDDLFSGAAATPTKSADLSPESASEDQDFPSTGPTRKGADLAPASIRKTFTKAAEVTSAAPDQSVPAEALVKGFQSALAQASVALQEQAAHIPSEPSSASLPVATTELVANAVSQESIQPAMHQPSGTEAPVAQPGALQQPQQTPQQTPQAPQVSTERSAQPLLPETSPQPAPPPAPPHIAPDVTGQVSVSQNAINQATPVAQSPPSPPVAPSVPPSSAIPGSPVSSQTDAYVATEQRSWESPWEKEQKSQQAQSPAHRSIPATPKSVFESPPEAVESAHNAELPLGELNLDQFSQEHNYDGTPPTRADMHQMHGEYHPHPTIPVEQSEKTTASGKDPDDISDLLELAAKAPSKKKGGKGKSGAKAVSDLDMPSEPASDLPESGPIPDPVPYLDNDFIPAQRPQYAPQPPTQQARQQPQQPWGEQIQQLQQGAQLYSPPEFLDHHPRCPHCYVALEGGSRFCGECGYTLPERIPVCQKCNTALEPGAKFCGECGAKQIDMKAPAVVASSLGITQAELANVPPEALSSTENFKRYMSAINPQGQQTWMVKLLKFLEQ